MRRALAVLLGAFSVYSVVAVIVGLAENRFVHFRVVAVVIGLGLVLGLAALAARLAIRSWRKAKPN